MIGVFIKAGRQAIRTMYMKGKMPWEDERSNYGDISAR
jgi:hypothetical protein